MFFHIETSRKRKNLSVNFGAFMEHLCSLTENFESQIPVGAEYSLGPIFIECCTGNAEDNQDEEQHQNLSVGELVYC